MTSQLNTVSLPHDDDPQEDTIVNIFQKNPSFNIQMSGLKS